MGSHVSPSALQAMVQQATGSLAAMTRMILALPFALLAARPAHVTGGLVCRTAGAEPVQVSVVIGHVYGSPLVSAQLLDDGRNVPVSKAQWWVGRSELRLLLTNSRHSAEELVLRAKRNGDVYDGSVWRHGKRRWVRCRES